MQSMSWNKKQRCQAQRRYVTIKVNVSNKCGNQLLQYKYVNQAPVTVAGPDADGSVCQAHKRPSCPQGNRQQLSWTSPRKHKHRKSYVNRLKNQTIIWQLVHHQNDGVFSSLADDQCSKTYFFLYTLFMQGMSVKPLGQQKPTLDQQHQECFLSLDAG